MSKIKELPADAPAWVMKDRQVKLIYCGHFLSVHIPLRRSRQTGVAGATGPDYRSHRCIGSIVTVPEPDPYHKLLSDQQCWLGVLLQH